MLQAQGSASDLEQCDGTDQNCDGRIDETFPESGEACSTGKPGVCGPGTRICTVGTLGCRQSVQPSTELCNGLDDDCNGQVDETFDFNTDSQHCGGCGRGCDAGTACFNATCRETACDDGTDNDLDGLTDCADLSCLGQTCDNLMAPPWRCGARLPFDAGVDGGFDGGFDGGLDAGPDAGADAGLDGGSDAGADAGSDAGVDAGSDAGAGDGGPVLGCYPPETGLRQRLRRRR